MTIPAFMHTIAELREENNRLKREKGLLAGDSLRTSMPDWMFMAPFEAAMSLAEEAIALLEPGPKAQELAAQLAELYQTYGIQRGS